MKKRVLIAYGTRYEATTEVAAVISNILEKEYNFDVEIYTLKKGRIPPDLSEFDFVIVGSGIKDGQWVKEAEQFLDNDFSNKKLAVFISSSFAGDKKLYAQAEENFLNVIIKKHNLNPVFKAAFGGRIPLLQIPKIYILRIMQRLPYFQFDNRDWEKN